MALEDYIAQFRGVSLPQIDQARRQNALGNLDLLQAQRQNAVMANPDATQEQLARAGRPDIANALASQQQVTTQQKATATGIVAQRFAAIAQSQDPLGMSAMFIQSPEFQQLGKVVGFDPSSYTITPQDTADSIRQSAADHAAYFGQQGGYTLNAGDTRYNAANQPIATGQKRAADAPSGYQLDPNKPGNLMPIPGGPADKPQIGSLLTPEGMDLAAQEYLNTGKLPPGLGKASAGINAQIVSRAAAIASANGDDAKAAALNRASFVASRTALSALTKQRTLVGAFERTALKNLEIAVEESQRVDRTGVPAINRWLLAGKKSLGGDVEVGRFHAALTSALNEYAKVLSGATGAAGISDAARREAESLLSTANTAEQVLGITEIMKREMANREAGFAEQEAQLRETMSGRPSISVAPAATGAPTAPGASIASPSSTNAAQQSAGKVLTYDPATGTFR